jgi:HK97 family phage major capsid protein
MLEQKDIEQIGEIFGKMLAEKEASILESVKSAAIENKSIIKNGEVVDEAKSVMNVKRYKAPFVTVGTEAKAFLQSVRKSVSEGVAADGGFTVSEEFDAAIASYAAEESVVRSRAYVVTMKKLTKKLPKLDQGSSVFGGVTMAWADEAEAATPSSPKFKQVVLTAHKMIGLTTASSEILEDSDVDMANYLVQLFGMAAVHFEDTAFLTGDGDAKPTGIISTLGACPVVKRAVANQVSDADMKALKNKVPASLRKNGVYIMDTTAIEYVEGLKDTTGRPLWQPSISEGRLPTYGGYPVVETEKLSTLGTKGDVVFANLGLGYAIGDRRGLEVAASIHSKFNTDEIEFRLTKRVDGQVRLPQAFAVLDVPQA